MTLEKDGAKRQQLELTSDNSKVDKIVVVELGM